MRKEKLSFSSLAFRDSWAYKQLLAALRLTSASQTAANDDDFFDFVTGTEQ